LNTSLPAENRTYYVTFDPDLARTRDDVELIGFGHRLFDAAIEESLEEPGRGACVRIVRSEIEAPEVGALFNYELFIGAIREDRSLIPVYVSGTTKPSFELGAEILRASPRSAPPGIDDEQILNQVGATLDEWAQAAEDLATQALVERKAERVAEQDRLYEAEHAHLSKYFEHKTRELKRTLRHAAQTRDRIASFPEDDSRRRILPTWEKRVEGAGDALTQAEQERTRRLEDLDGRRKTEIRLELVQAAAIVRVPNHVGP
jgi:hypothetical protein